MDIKKVFCEACRNEVGYTVYPAAMTGTVKGREYRYTGREARCSDCGAILFVPEISDGNLQALYDVFRAENGIVPLDVVRTIPKKYAIGKRPLSLLLGWGELTFTRYCDGDMPTRQYSDILKRIYEDPRAYAGLLEANKGNLPSEHTYEKSRRAVDALLGHPIPAEPVRRRDTHGAAEGVVLYPGILLRLLRDLSLRRGLSGLGARARIPGHLFPLPRSSL